MCIATTAATHYDASTMLPRTTRHHHRAGRPVALALLLVFAPGASADAPVVQSWTNSESIDQDDMCVWLHPDDTSQSLVVATDKYSGNVFVYDLQGALRQTIFTGKPGNVDVRYGFLLGGACIDLIAFNERDEDIIRIYSVDPALRTLTRVDDGIIDTGSNYGFTLHHDGNGTFHAITGDGLLQQYLLFETTTGQIGASATGWSVQQGTVEGMVADDESGWVYLAEEQVGIWRVATGDHTDKVLIAQAGDGSGLQADVEGLTLYHVGTGSGWLIASSQGASHFTVFERQPPHTPVGNFELTSVGATDGIDVVNLPLDALFPQGMFVAHNGHDPAGLVATRWQDIVTELPALAVDTSWDPRACGTPSAIDEHAPRAGTPVLLGANQPNPFNPRTTIPYEITREGHVRVDVYDITGRHVRRLVEARHPPGPYRTTWDGRSDSGRALSSGIYVCRAASGEFAMSRKLVLAR